MTGRRSCGLHRHSGVRRRDDARGKVSLRRLADDEKDRHPMTTPGLSLTDPSRLADDRKDMHPTHTPAVVLIDTSRSGVAEKGVSLTDPLRSLRAICGVRIPYARQREIGALWF